MEFSALCGNHFTNLADEKKEEEEAKKKEEEKKMANDPVM